MDIRGLALNRHVPNCFEMVISLKKKSSRLEPTTTIPYGGRPQSADELPSIGLKN